MAGGKGAVSLDTVMIKIESDAGRSTKGIDALTKSLANLKSAISGGFNNINKLSAALDGLHKTSAKLGSTVSNLTSVSNVADSLKELSTIETPKGLNSIVKRLAELDKEASKLSGTANNLTAISDMVPYLSELSTVKAPSGLTSVVKNLDGLAKMTNLDAVVGEVKKIPDMVEPLSKLGDIVNPRGMTNAVKNLRDLPEIMNKIDTKTFENLKRVSEELAQSLGPVADKMGQIAAGYSAFSKIQNTFGKSASTSLKYMKQHKSVLASLGGLIKKVSSGFAQTGRNIATAFGKGATANLKKFHSRFKQVFLSLLGTRTLFTMIRKAVAEYEAFDVTLQKFSRNVWRAFGAQLAPIIEYVMELFKQFVRVIYSIVYALTGIDLIARANEKAMAEWGKAAKDTLGNLQKFDDLNVVEFPKGSGDEFEKIELDKIDLTPIQKIIDWMRKLKKEIQEAFDTGEWFGVGKVFAEGISEGVAFLNNSIGVIREKLFEVAKDFGNFLNGVITGTNWGEIGTFITNALVIIPDMITELLRTVNWTSLGEGLAESISTFDPAEVVNSFMTLLSTAISGLTDTLLGLNWSDIGSKIGDTISTFFTDLKSILDKIPWYQLGERVREAIENVPWAEVWSNVFGAASSAVGGINESLSGLTGLDVDSIERLETAFIGIGLAVKGIQALAGIGKLVGELSVGFGNLSKAAGGIGKAFSGLSSASGASGVLGQLSSFLGGASAGTLGTIAAVAVAVVVAIMALVTAFKELYESGGAFKETVDGLIESMGGTFSSIIEAAVHMFDGLKNVLQNLWENVLVPLFDLLVEIAKPFVEAIMELLHILWVNIIDPLVQVLLQGLMFAWDQLCIAMDAFMFVLGPVIDVLTWLWKKVLSPIVSFVLDVVIWVIEQVAKRFKKNMDFIADVFEVLRGTMKFIWEGIKTVLGIIGDWIYKHVVKPVVDKFNEMKKKVTEAWEGIWENIKPVINSILSGVEKFINRIINGINNLSKGLRTIGNKIFDIIGVDVTFEPMKEVSLPRLETGTNEIPYEGIYHLHPGEAVVPKKYNPALGNGGSEEMVAKMDTLIDIMNNMNTTTIVNVGNKKLYEGQQAFNKTQQNKYGTINLY